MQESFDIIAHRGASGYEFENSMSAFCKAIELKANFIETDVRKTKDNVLVLSHNNNLIYSTNLNKKISKSTFKEIGFITLKNGELIPTVEDLLSILKNKIKINFEIKGKNIEKSLINLVKSHDSLENVVFSSFSLDILRKIKNIEPNARLQFIIKFPTVLIENV